MGALSSRNRTYIEDGPGKRLRRIRYLFHLVHTSMPDGIDRVELLLDYQVNTGCTAKKAEEHLQLLEAKNYVLWDDLQMFTTDEGLRWAGYKRDATGNLVDPSEKAEEQYRNGQHTHTHARASANKTSKSDDGNDSAPVAPTRKPEA